MTNKFLVIKLLTIIGLFSLSVFGQSKAPAKPTLIGKWKSNEAKVEFLDKSKMTINGDKFNYAVVGKIIIVESGDGQMEFPFTLKDDTLTVWVENRKVVYTRVTKDDEDEEEVQPRNNGGSVLQELVGTWCYQADVQANNGGGRHSRICFTLYANGTYAYSSGSSNTNPNGGSVSESTDYGRWAATATTLTARSNSGETRTYTLEKRNHPKTGDPMLIVDGDAFVTQYQKRPW